MTKINAISPARLARLAVLADRKWHQEAGMLDHALVMHGFAVVDKKSQTTHITAAGLAALT